ncbi:phototropism 2-like [Octopus vulgaris]|uniref:Phototropism 2-like n=2 Tax=Octopus TaxID=6643 RepID=A0AA36AKC3_OCTVU|nr:BTB/POZ domain-containing protein At1g30440-like [Octopus sinensis]XP_036355329.1 BTB/POZ domain-containing protein At1g30440-like [Octopus sinensis]XP_036355339.1 BTB/POZ domain-containing protein At1g30440-like [Octopus sinensis]CAI9717708.1 phototropism 2-like [Octopus vulgaris]
MSYAKFRENGEFSDITIWVGNTEFKLHRFPLLTKSDYICKRVRELSEGIIGNVLSLELKDFPGGSDVFGLIADFCYGINISLIVDNVVELRLAAAYLEMMGTDNLIEMTEKFIENMVMSSKISRSADTIIKLLQNCCNVREMAEEIGLVDKCTDALARCWSTPPTRFSNPNRKKLIDVYDSGVVEQLYELPIAWIIKVIACAKEKGVQKNCLSELILSLMRLGMENSFVEKGDFENLKKNDDQSGKPHIVRDCDLIRDTKYVNSEENEPGRIKRSTIVMATMLEELPPETFENDFFSVDNILTILPEIISCEPQQRQAVLKKVISPLFNRLSSGEISLINPDVMYGIVTSSFAADPSMVNELCKIINVYVIERSQRNSLKKETFKMLLTSIPLVHQPNSDKILEVLECLIDSEQGMPKEERTSLIKSVDWSAFSEEALEKSLDKSIIPSKYIARAAVNLCKRLRQTFEHLEKSRKAENDRVLVTSANGSFIAGDYLRVQSSDRTREEELQAEANDSEEELSNVNHMNTNLILSTDPLETTGSHVLPSNYTFRALNFDESSLDEDFSVKYDDLNIRDLDHRLKIQAPTSNYSFKPYNYYVKPY